MENSFGIVKFYPGFRRAMCWDDNEVSFPIYQRPSKRLHATAQVRCLFEGLKYIQGSFQ